jgi:hypothetical protein
MPWRWPNKLRRKGQSRSATTVADRPEAVLQLKTLPKKERTNASLTVPKTLLNETV